MALSDMTLNKIFRWIAAAAALVVLLILAYEFMDVLTIFIVSVLLAFIFNPVVNWIERLGLHRGLAVIIVMVTSILLISFALSTLIPKITNQVQALANNLTEKKVNDIVGEFETSVKSAFPFLSSINISENITKTITSGFMTTVRNLSDILSSIFSIMALVVIVPFMTFFLLKDNSQIIKGIIGLMPNKYFEMSYWVIKKITIQLGNYVRAWILDALFVGVTAGIGLTILGVHNSITIGMIAGMGHLIPYFGPVIGGLPAIIIALLQFGDFSMLLSISIMFVIIYSFDNGYIQPKLLSHGTDIHPLLIIILILIGSQALGILGMLLAVPATTVIKTAVKEIYYGYKNYKIIHVKETEGI